MPYDNCTQCHSTHMGGAWPKASTAKPKTTGRAGHKPGGGPDPVECPTNWIQVQMIQNPVPPRCWKELRSIYRESAGELNPALVQQSTQWQVHPSWCPLPRKRHQASGKPHIVFQGWVIETSYLMMISPVPGISERRGRRRPWCWPELCNIVQRSQGCLPESCAMQCGTFKGVWHPWCIWRGMKYWRLHC